MALVVMASSADGGGGNGGCRGQLFKVVDAPATTPSLASMAMAKTPLSPPQLTAASINNDCYHRCGLC
jgi:hypothetical protein